MNPMHYKHNIISHGFNISWCVLNEQQIYIFKGQQKSGKPIMYSSHASILSHPGSLYEYTIMISMV